ncbi:MAG TPA: recombination mediator RecR [Patescibacteria group bacterium]
MQKFPEPVKNLIEQFNRLPGIGHKTSQKFVFYLLKQPKEVLTGFAGALLNLNKLIEKCAVCGNIATTSPCSICDNQQRNQNIICVVAETYDLISIENTGDYTGLYHVLGGAINTVEGVSPDQLNIKSLLTRINQKKPEEIILAFSPDLEGESTVLYLKNLLSSYQLKLTRLAKGLPMGSVLEYADEVTLSNALKGRTMV